MGGRLFPGCPRAAVLVAAVLAAAVPIRARAHSPHDVILEVAASPDGDRIVAQYAYPERRLLLVSEDRGESWAFVAAEPAREVFEDLVFAGESVLYAADGVHPHLHVSEDGGWTWGETAEPDGSALLCVVPVPGDEPGVVVFAGTESGMYRSEDGGVSWSELDGLTADPVHRVVAVEGGAGGPILAALAGERQLWISVDGGDTWELRLELGIQMVPSCLAVSPEFAADGHVWVGTIDGTVFTSHDGGDSWALVPIDPDGSPNRAVNDLLALSSDRVLGIREDHAVLCSSDAGMSWRECSHGIPEQYDQESQIWGHYRRLEGDPGGEGPALLASWEGLVKSEDGGTTWQEACTLLPTFARALAFSPGYPDDTTVWIGSYGSGLYETRDHGQNWSVLATEQERLYAISFVPSPRFPEDPLLLMVATRKLLRSVDGGTSWELAYVTGIDELHSVVLSPRFEDHRVGYALGTSGYAGRPAVSRTTDGGETWVSVWVADPSGAPQIEEVLFSPTVAGTLYARQTDPPAVLRSTDGGSDWDVLTSFPDGPEVAALFAFDAGGGDQLLAVAADGRMWRGEPGAGTWDELQELDPPGVFLGRQLPPAASGEPGALFLSLDPPGIARSLDGGDTWEILQTPFHSVVLRIAAPPGYPADSALVVSTHHGTFFTCDDGEQWHLLDRLIRFEDDACSLRYRGKGWERLEGEGTGLAHVRSEHGGDAVALAFSGHTARWLTRRFPGAGGALVSLDGVPVAEVSLHVERVTESAVFEYAAGDDGPHTLEIQVAGDGPVVVDAVEVVRDRAANGAVESYEFTDWCPPPADPGEPDDDDSAAENLRGEGGDCSCQLARAASPGGASLASLAVLLALRSRRARGRRPCNAPAPPVR